MGRKDAGLCPGARVAARYDPAVEMLSCHDGMRRDTLQIRIDPQLREQLARLRSHHHLNVSSWARQVIAEALEQQFPELPPPAPPDPEPPARPPASKPIPGWRPCRLPDGSWGSSLHDPPPDLLSQDLPGRSISVTDRSGQSWIASVSSVIELSPSRITVADSGRPPRQP